MSTIFPRSIVPVLLLAAVLACLGSWAVLHGRLQLGLALMASAPAVLIALVAYAVRTERRANARLARNRQHRPYVPAPEPEPAQHLAEAGRASALHVVITLVALAAIGSWLLVALAVTR